MIVLSDTHAPPPRRKRKQIFDDYAGEYSTLKQREHGYRWVEKFIKNLAVALRRSFSK
jgi:hypothetical protein